MSPEFADEAALCLAANGIKAYVFESLRPTPELSYAVRKLGINTHLYQSAELVEAFPGRIWKIQAVVDKTKQKLLSGQQANILTRNYPLKPDDIRKKLKLRDGGEQYIIGARIADKAVLLLADRIK